MAEAFFPECKHQGINKCLMGPYRMLGPHREVSKNSGPFVWLSGEDIK